MTSAADRLLGEMIMAEGAGGVVGIEAYTDCQCEWSEGGVELYVDARCAAHRAKAPTVGERARRGARLVSAPVGFRCPWPGSHPMGDTATSAHEFRERATLPDEFWCVRCGAVIEVTREGA